MADYRKLPPFIYQAEGGLVNASTDAGGLTNKGITYSVWISVFGDTMERFKAMQPADWMVIFKKNFWDHALGDNIKSQRVANMIGDWVWGSGQFFPEKHVQHILNEILDKHIQKHIEEDGAFGHATINVLNTEPEEELYNDLIADRKQYYLNLCQNDIATIKAANPGIEDLDALAKLATKAKMKYLPNLHGWNNRVDNLVKYNETLAA